MSDLENVAFKLRCRKCFDYFRFAVTLRIARKHKRRFPVRHLCDYAVIVYFLACQHIVRRSKNFHLGVAHRKGLADLGKNDVDILFIYFFKKFDPRFG